MEYPKADRELTLEEQVDLVNRLTTAAAELQSLAANETFRFHSLTASVARLVQDWCLIAGPEIEALRDRATGDNDS